MVPREVVCPRSRCQKFWAPADLAVLGPRPLGHRPRFGVLPVRPLGPSAEPP
jgi:hypothetical protein